MSSPAIARALAEEVGPAAEVVCSEWRWWGLKPALSLVLQSHNHCSLRASRLWDQWKLHRRPHKTFLLQRHQLGQSGTRLTEKERGLGSFSLWHWLVVIMLVLLLFGRGRISGMMGDIGMGLKSFKQGMADEDGDQLRRYSEQRRDEGPPPLPSDLDLPERDSGVSKSKSPWGNDDANRP